MSTRKYLKDRKKFFVSLQKKEPTNLTYSHIIDELDFLLEALVEFDKKKANGS